MRRPLKNNCSGKIQKKHARKLKQKERRFYKNVCQSGEIEKSYIRGGISYVFFYKKYRNKKQGGSRNKLRVAKNIKKTNFSSNIISLPSCVDFYENCNRSETIQKLLDIYSFKKSTILIDFAVVHKMSASATAMLFSTIKHVQLNLNKQVGIKLPKSKKMKAVLKQIGLLDFLNIQTPVNVSEHKDVCCWYAKNDYQLLTPQSIKEIVDGIIKNSKNNNLSVEQHIKKINTTLGETILNVSEHAYLDSNFKYLNWVFFARISHSKNGKIDKLSLIACDSGIGIAETFKKYVDSTKFDSVKKFFKTDSDYIKEAVTNSYNTSKKQKTNQTRKEGRGTGLTKIYNDAKKMQNSVLSIYSHGGFFSSTGNSVKFKRNVPGTVIELIIPLE